MTFKADPALRPDPADPFIAKLLDLCTFAVTGTLHLAVSGGADSLTLMALAVAARTTTTGATIDSQPGREITAHHVDHGLRPASATEANPVRELALAWEIGFESHQVDVSDGPNLEERCRMARRQILPPSTLYGHTADDQAETVLLRILRGTGPSGLAAMDPSTHPILGIRRSDTLRVCGHLGIVAFSDPSNTDLRFTRNRVRHELLPLMCDISDRDPVPLLSRLAEQAGAQREILEELAAELDPTDATAVREAPGALARVALVKFWQSETGGLPVPDAGAMQRMLEVASGTSVATDVCRGWRLHRSSGQLRLVGPEPAGNVEARE